MEVNTRDYGVIDVDESAIIRFEDGIIGFEGYRDYVLIDDAAGQSPFRRLQSVEDSGLAFILLDPFSVKPDYEFMMEDDLIERLSVENANEVVVLAIVVVPDDVKKISFNLKAPLVINANLRKGVQYVVDRSNYGVRHYLFEELERADSARLCEDKKAV